MEEEEKSSSEEQLLAGATSPSEESEKGRQDSVTGEAYRGLVGPLGVKALVRQAKEARVLGTTEEEEVSAGESEEDDENEEPKGLSERDEELRVAFAAVTLEAKERRAQGPEVFRSQVKQEPVEVVDEPEWTDAQEQQTDDMKSGRKSRAGAGAEQTGVQQQEEASTQDNATSQQQQPNNSGSVFEQGGDVVMQNPSEASPQPAAVGSVTLGGPRNCVSLSSAAAMSASETGTDQPGTQQATAAATGSNQEMSTEEWQVVQGAMEIVAETATNIVLKDAFSRAAVEEVPQGRVAFGDMERPFASDDFSLPSFGAVTAGVSNDELLVCGVSTSMPRRAGLPGPIPNPGRVDAYEELTVENVPAWEGLEHVILPHGAGDITRMDDGVYFPSGADLNDRILKKLMDAAVFCRRNAKGGKGAARPQVLAMQWQRLITNAFGDKFVTELKEASFGFCTERTRAPGEIRQMVTIATADDLRRMIKILELEAEIYGVIGADIEGLFVTMPPEGDVGELDDSDDENEWRCRRAIELFGYLPSMWLRRNDCGMFSEQSKSFVATLSFATPSGIAFVCLPSAIFEKAHDGLNLDLHRFLCRPPKQSQEWRIVWHGMKSDEEMFLRSTGYSLGPHCVDLQCIVQSLQVNHPELRSDKPVQCDIHGRGMVSEYQFSRAVAWGPTLHFLWFVFTFEDLKKELGFTHPPWVSEDEAVHHAATCRNSSVDVTRFGEYNFRNVANLEDGDCCERVGYAAKDAQTIVDLFALACFTVPELQTTDSRFIKGAVQRTLWMHDCNLVGANYEIWDQSAAMNPEKLIKAAMTSEKSRGMKTGPIAECLRLMGRALEHAVKQAAELNRIGIVSLSAESRQGALCRATTRLVQSCLAVFSLAPVTTPRASLVFVTEVIRSIQFMFYAKATWLLAPLQLHKPLSIRGRQCREQVQLRVNQNTEGWWLDKPDELWTKRAATTVEPFREELIARELYFEDSKYAVVDDERVYGAYPCDLAVRRTLRSSVWRQQESKATTSVVDQYEWAKAQYRQLKDFMADLDPDTLPAVTYGVPVASLMVGPPPTPMYKCIFERQRGDPTAAEQTLHVQSAELAKKAWENLAPGDKMFIWSEFRRQHQYYEHPMPSEEVFVERLVNERRDSKLTPIKHVSCVRSDQWDHGDSNELIMPEGFRNSKFIEYYMNPFTPCQSSGSLGYNMPAVSNAIEEKFRRYRAWCIEAAMEPLGNAGRAIFKTKPRQKPWAVTYSAFQRSKFVCGVPKECFGRDRRPTDLLSSDELVNACVRTLQTDAADQQESDKLQEDVKRGRFGIFDWFKYAQQCGVSDVVKHRTLVEVATVMPEIASTMRPVERHELTRRQQDAESWQKAVFNALGGPPGNTRQPTLGIKVVLADLGYSLLELKCRLLEFVHKLTNETQLCGTMATGLRAFCEPNIPVYSGLLQGIAMNNAVYHMRVRQVYMTPYVYPLTGFRGVTTEVPDGFVSSDSVHQEAAKVWTLPTAGCIPVKGQQQQQPVPSDKVKTVAVKKADAGVQTVVGETPVFSGRKVWVSVPVELCSTLDEWSHRTNTPLEFVQSDQLQRVQGSSEDNTVKVMDVSEGPGQQEGQVHEPDDDEQPDGVKNNTHGDQGDVGSVGTVSEVTSEQGDEPSSSVHRKREKGNLVDWDIGDGNSHREWSPCSGTDSDEEAKTVKKLEEPEVVRERQRVRVKRRLMEARQAKKGAHSTWVDRVVKPLRFGSYWPKQSEKGAMEVHVCMKCGVPGHERVVCIVDKQAGKKMRTQCFPAVHVIRCLSLNRGQGVARAGRDGKTVSKVCWKCGLIGHGEDKCDEGWFSSRDMPEVFKVMLRRERNYQNELRSGKVKQPKEDLRAVLKKKVSAGFHWKNDFELSDVRRGLLYQRTPKELRGDYERMERELRQQERKDKESKGRSERRSVKKPKVIETDELEFGLDRGRQETQMETEEQGDEVQKEDKGASGSSVTGAEMTAVDVMMRAVQAMEKQMKRMDQKSRAEGNRRKRGRHHRSDSSSSGSEVEKRHRRRKH